MINKKTLNDSELKQPQIAKTPSPSEAIAFDKAVGKILAVFEKAGLDNYDKVYKIYNDRTNQVVSASSSEEEKMQALEYVYEMLVREPNTSKVNFGDSGVQEVNKKKTKPFASRWE